MLKLIACATASCLLALAVTMCVSGCAVTHCRPNLRPNPEILSGASSVELSMLQTMMMFGPFIRCEVE